MTKPRPPAHRPPKHQSRTHRPRRHQPRAQGAPGIDARRAAATLLAAVLRNGQRLDDALAAEHAATGTLAPLAPRDRGFARTIATTALRRHGQISDILTRFLDKPLPRKAGIAPYVLRGALAELLFLDSAAHATVSANVALAKSDTHARHFAGLINAVLRRAARDGAALRDGQDPYTLNTPPWLLHSWRDAYGAEATAAIAAAHLKEAPLDLTVAGDAPGWAQRLGGALLPTGSVRLTQAGRVEALPGFAAGAWWVQDAAAALPVRLFGDVAGKHVIDLCAAPVGKTLQLAAAGARVTAIDRSAKRLEQLRDNLTRTQLTADLITADATAWAPAGDAAPADLLLLDAPCSATGTLRRHPDIALLKAHSDIAKMVHLQAELLANAARLCPSGGTLVYCTCALQPEEGEHHIERFLAANPAFSRKPITAADLPGLDAAITAAGDMRTLPSFWAHQGGMDGFFAARLVRA